MANEFKFENNIYITGYVGRKPEHRTFESGKRLATFSIAISQPTRGGRPQKPMWLDVEAWDDMADRVQEQQFGKGSVLTVFGALAPNYYEQKVGDTYVEMQKVRIKLAEFNLEIAKNPDATESAGTAAVAEAGPSLPAESEAPQELAATKRSRVRRTA